MSKKLLFITHQLSRTGAPIVLLDMIKVCLKHDATVDVISLLDGELRTDLEQLGLIVTIKDDFFKDREAFENYAASYNVVVANTLITYQVIHVLNGTNIPVIWWLHEGEQYFEYFKTVLPDFALLKSNIRTFAVGHYVQDVVKRRYGCTIPILHFGIKDQSDIATLESTYWDTIDPGHKKIRFFTVGTYSQVKAQDTLCAAIRTLAPSVKNNCCFLFCGNEENCDQQIYSTVEQTCLADLSAHKLPAQPHEMTLQLMKHCDYLVIPSRIDPIPTVAVEAMMLSKPCLITDVCGVAHYLKNNENALLLVPENVKRMQRQLEYAAALLQETDKYEALGKESRRVFYEHFSFEQFEPQVTELLQLLPPKPRLIFMTGVYDILDIFTYELISAFQALGYDTMEFNTSNMQQGLVQLSEFIKEPVTAMITFNNLGFNMELVPGKNTWDELGIWCINILMDHPFCHKEALDHAPARSIVLCPDRNHMNYVQRFYPNIPITGYLPHAGKDKHLTPRPIRDRSIDVIYAGGLSRDFAYKMMPDFTQYTFDARHIADTAYADLISHPAKTTEQAIEDALTANNIHLTETALCDFIEQIHYIDLLAVSHYREAAVRMLVEAGVSVTLYGTGWDNCEWLSAPNLHFGGRISADAVVDKMQDAKIVLSTMTWFKDGTHDRVFNGMLAGAVAVTDSSIYMHETFCGDPDDPAAELAMFELDNMEQLPRIVKVLLADPDHMQQIADLGRKKALADHTWQARARELHEDLLSQL